MSYEILVENVKCGGCANTIRSKISAEPGIESVEVDVEAGRVTVDGDEAGRPAIVARLAQLGYPEVGSVEGLKAAGAKAKSFVSCAIGRIEVAKSGGD